jgi:hypothetical protein
MELSHLFVRSIYRMFAHPRSHAIEVQLQALERANEEVRPYLHCLHGILQLHSVI